MNQFPSNLLETLIAFNNEQTLQKAANKLQLTQPAVTKQLQRLEELAPYPLFALIGRRKKLTPYGLQIANAAQDHFEKLSEQLSVIGLTHSDGENLQLKVGGRREFLVRYLENLKNFKGRIDFIERSSTDVIEDLLNKRLDLAITHKTDVKLEYIQKKIGSDQACLIIPKTWKVSTDAKSFLAASAKWPTAIYSEEIIANSISKKAAKDFPKLNVKIVISDWQQIEKWVHQQKFWAVVPKLFCTPNRDYHMTDLNAFSLSHDYFIYYRPELAKLNWFQDILKQILKKHI